MKNYIQVDEWKIIEKEFKPEHNEIIESLCSIGNGHMGQRANFEEDYSGASLQGSYVGGVYYPDKTRVGWWKNGYPEYFAKVLNSINWIGIRIAIDGQNIDIAKLEIISFERILDMQKGLLTRSVTFKLATGKKVSIQSTRFVSMADEEIGAIKFTIKAESHPLDLQIESYLDADVSNKDSNYEEKFWNSKTSEAENNILYLAAITKKTNFTVGVAAKTSVSINSVNIPLHSTVNEAMYVAQFFDTKLAIGESCLISKTVVLATSRNHQEDQIRNHILNKILLCHQYGFSKLLNDQIAKWSEIWSWCDIVIEGDTSAQQAIRFNIFQLLQTYTGTDARLNIGPKGFTGEKYGGSTYWDTEAYCLPFYLSTVGADVARNLLIYRYNHLSKAIENACKLGFTKGAALYPMVTMNGEECHNEWEITFEEIHRNGAIAYAIYDFIRYTNDHSYLLEYGLEVLIGIARFWAQRVSWSSPKNAFVILGVTGPNEYENNVNNNWYTNYIAQWCLNYTLKSIELIQNENPEKLKYIYEITNFEISEIKKWNDIIENIYLPEDKSLGIFLQQEGYMDKEQQLVETLDQNQRPINQNWSWDRILRSCFIKQADVLQGLYFFEDQFDESCIERNFNFYEPRTVHESSLSPCVHAILAAKLGKIDKAYEMYLRTARLDLDNYNNDTEDGLHITSMAGTWLSVIKGFAGMRIKDTFLHFSPLLPPQWNSISFNIRFRNNNITIYFNNELLKITNVLGPVIDIYVNNTKFTTSEKSTTVINIDKAVFH